MVWQPIATALQYLLIAMILVGCATPNEQDIDYAALNARQDNIFMLENFCFKMHGSYSERCSKLLNAWNGK